MAVRFVFITCGGQESYHLQAWYALLSVLAHAPAGTRPAMVTDQPERYRWFGDRVEVLPVDAATVAAWKGEHGFLWRMKIQAIRHAAARDASPLVYCDTDVVARGSLAGLEGELASGRVFMHRCENAFGRLRGRTGGGIRRALLGRTWAGVPVTRASEMWNAGVVAVADHALLDRALAVCDAILASGCSHSLIEQASFSLVLGATGTLHAADHALVHYWGNKPAWEAAIARQLAAVLIQDLRPAEAIELVRANPIDRPALVRRRWWNRYFKPLSGPG